MDPFEVVDRWFALLLTVGMLSALSIHSLFGLDQRNALFAGTGVALLVAVLWVRLSPESDSRFAWLVGMVALGVGIVLVLGAWFAGVRRLPDEEVLYPFVVGVALVAEWLRLRWRASEDGLAT